MLEAEKDREIAKLDKMCHKYDMNRVKAKVMGNLERELDDFELNQEEIDNKEQ